MDLPQNILLSIQKTLHELLENQKAKHPQTKLFEICEYALNTSGKMLRGLMVLEAYKLVGGNAEQILYAAAAIESGHLASLIHDDFMDQDHIRRGMRTVWAEYDQNAAILAGNLFIFEAFYCFSLCAQTISADRVIKGLEILSQTGIDLCFGQALETQLSGNCSTSTQDYITMVSYKTGKLFAAALKSGAVLGGANEEEIIALTEYGENLGIAFQIIDDLLPYIQNNEKKSTFSDIYNSRMTLPILYALSSTQSELVQILTQTLCDEKNNQKPAELLQRITIILHKTNAINQSKQDVIKYISIALQHLMILPPSTSVDNLKAIAEFLIRRID